MQRLFRHLFSSRAEETERGDTIIDSEPSEQSVYEEDKLLENLPPDLLKKIADMLKDMGQEAIRHNRENPVVNPPRDAYHEYFDFAEHIRRERADNIQRIFGARNVLQLLDVRQRRRAALEA